MNIGNTVSFTDKTGEQLEGKITGIGFDGNPSILQVLVFKKSWDMEVSCLIPREMVILKESYMERVLREENARAASIEKTHQCDECLEDNKVSKEGNLCEECLAIEDWEEECFGN